MQEGVLKEGLRIRGEGLAERRPRGRRAWERRICRRVNSKKRIDKSNAFAQLSKKVREKNILYNATKVL
jgi:hypothetical protein